MGTVPPVGSDRGKAVTELPPYWGGLVRLLDLRDFPEPRGSLVEFDFACLPFVPRRMFFVHSVPPGGVRGQHAHVRGRQLLCCVAGRLTVELRHAGEVRLVELSSRNQALLVSAPVWAAQHYDGPDTVLLVTASEPYDPAAYGAPSA